MKNRIRRALRYINKNFDKAFYRSRGKQFLWLGCLVLLVGLAGVAVSSLSGIGEWRVVELMLDPGTFAGAARNGTTTTAFIELTIAVAGAVVFTCLLINAVGNWLDRRVESYRNGKVIYEFDDHILILGVNDMLMNLLRSLTEETANKDRDIVVLTTDDVEELRSMIYLELPKGKAENIYVVYGNRTRREILYRLDAHETRAIYILGEEDEPGHDAINIECYELLKEICISSTNAIDCYLVIDRLTTIQNFYYRNEKVSTDKLHLTVINSYENAAQRLIVSRDYRENEMYPALDRDMGISGDSDTGVHLIIVGMSQMAYAVATTAAHVCHFPNFATKGIRTKITFIQKDILQEMDFFMARYRNLMNLSYARYVNPLQPEDNMEFLPLSEYQDKKEDRKGFLDIEWEFINGGIESEAARAYITECASLDDTNEHITIAFCDENAETNVAAALYLPHCIYERGIPVFVYQYGNGHVLFDAKKTSVYTNVYPFGMKSDCYDTQYMQRIRRARRIMHLYDVGEEYDVMPPEEVLKERWFGIQYAFQQSNLYAANSIPFKLRSIGNDGTRCFTSREIDMLSEAEHNRWNIERLLMGFRAYTQKERLEFRRLLMAGDKETKDMLNLRKKRDFIHKDIAPYNELLESSKEYDKNIVRNILEV